MDRQDSARRLLLVHAHPDDESIGTGATIAKYAAEGAQVTLVTCTRGELGEVIPPELAHLATDGDRLGEYRITELAAVIREVRPRVLVTYDENGFYGHPDHIQAHRVARRAVTLAADPAASAPGEPWQVVKFYVTAMPRSVAAAAGGRFWVPDEQVTTQIDGSAYLAAKIAAMRAHATQIAVDGEFFALADGAWQRIGDREFYTLLDGAASHSPEYDLFEGL